MPMMVYHMAKNIWWKCTIQHIPPELNACDIKINSAVHYKINQHLETYMQVLPAINEEDAETHDGQAYHKKFLHEQKIWAQHDAPSTKMTHQTINLSLPLCFCIQT